jgi:hypothetical protein
MTPRHKQASIMRPNEPIVCPQKRTVVLWIFPVVVGEFVLFVGEGNNTAENATTFIVLAAKFARWFPYVFVNRPTMPARTKVKCGNSLPARTCVCTRNQTIIFIVYSSRYKPDICRWRLKRAVVYLQLHIAMNILACETSDRRVKELHCDHVATKLPRRSKGGHSCKLGKERPASDNENPNPNISHQPAHSPESQYDSQDEMIEVSSAQGVPQLPFHFRCSTSKDCDPFHNTDNVSG